MPYPNEHAARQLEPEGFARYSSQDIAEGLRLIFGITPGGELKLQSIRADRARFTPAQFKAWLKRRGYQADIEPATGRGPRASD